MHNNVITSQTVMPRSLRRQLIKRLAEALAREASFLGRLPKRVLRRFVRRFLRCYVRDRSLIERCIRAGTKAGALCGLLLALMGEARAATSVFTAVTGASNPFNGVDSGFLSSPAFVDIDNDGDFDAFLGDGDGTIKFYQNTGSNSNSVFTEVTGASNPFNGVDVGRQANPVFVDIDNDGDFDAFVAESNGTIKYYRNTGSNSSAVLTAVTGASNPFNGVNVVSYSYPKFVDIDNDGDFDCFVGKRDGTILYYQNTGTNSSPVFTAVTGASNPFNGVDVGNTAIPAFVDIDNDGDRDAFVGESNGFILYYQNTGSNSSPAFTSIPHDGMDFWFECGFSF